MKIKLIPKTLISVKKSLTFMLLISLVLGNLTTLNAQETQTEKDTVGLQEVVLQMGRLQPMQDEGKIVTQITAAEIQQIPVNSISEILDFEPGLDIRQRGAADIQADISIRGGTFDQNMILLNGINVSNPQTGHNTLNLPIDLSAVDKIEIIKGAGAKLYGFNAFSGAVNFVSGKQKSPLKVRLTGGDFGYLKTSAQSQFKTGKLLQHSVTTSYAKSDGDYDNTDFKTGNVFYHGKLNLQKTKVELMAGYADKAFGANSFFTPKFPNQFEETSTQLGALKFQQQFKKLNLQANAYAYRSNDRFELFRDNAPDWYGQHNYHQTDVLAGQVKANYYHAYGKTSLYTEIRQESIKSNVLGEATQDTISDHNWLYTPTKDGFFTKKYKRNIGDISLGHQLRFRDFVLNATLKTLFFENSVKLYPGADLAYSFNRSQELVFSVNSSMRLPTFTDLFYEGPTQKSNPNLKAEEAVTYDLSYQFKNPTIGFYTSIFYRDATNLIDWALAEDEEIYRSKNIASLSSYGLEVSAAVNLTKWSSGVLQDLRIGYSFLENRQPNNNTVSSYINDYLKHKVNANLVLAPISDFTISLGGVFQKRNGKFERYRNTVSQGMQAYKSFVNLKANASYRVDKFTIFANLYNILDTEVYDYGNIPLPGRWLKVGVEYSI